MGRIYVVIDERSFLNRKNKQVGPTDAQHKNNDEASIKNEIREFNSLNSFLPISIADTKTNTATYAK